jgi:hypothetical protein
MPTKREPPSSVIALLAQILRDRRQTWHAAVLVFSLALALAVVLVPVLVVLVQFGTTGAAAVGGAGGLATAGMTARRAVAARQGGNGRTHR